MAETTAISDVILTAIKEAVDNHTHNYDHTYKTKVIGTYSNGTYSIKDESGQNRTVKCAIPDVELTTGQSVWATIPANNIRNTFISGVA